MPAAGTRRRRPPTSGRFEALLELPDPLLAGYFLAGDIPADPALAGLVARIRTYVA